MKKLIIFLVASLCLIEASAQGCWKKEYIKDEFDRNEMVIVHYDQQEIIDAAWFPIAGGVLKIFFNFPEDAAVHLTEQAANSNGTLPIYKTYVDYRLSGKTKTLYGNIRYKTNILNSSEVFWSYVIFKGFNLEMMKTKDSFATRYYDKYLEKTLTKTINLGGFTKAYNQ